ncbi:MAG: hypothetical protein LKI34_07385 [Bifidobacterium tibiigranuli]|jgi:hypothetical protein|uniref:DUF6036 family nucleotidyltransferase n=1 Tax=Bifidobacterium tibiigranuli TaxID=2172043 RepID=UPI0026EE7318|nr:DUF6036 family nucleotidyltransferase [Bifidobacterium tibiigranuli]MCI1674018.1 hypothetical protein [Bifidobacterium tibiigranuli]MCI1714010.1 hypothetical protein [Bifidobacterium tibiigranuli]MCI1833400.1 hypothetical protein [Bifidobacterium tibiigranuli]
MNREEFYHLLRASSRIIEHERGQRGIDTDVHPARILVLGSQSILGSWHEDYLPEEATYSIEMDVALLPTEDDVMFFDDPAQELVDIIDASIGEGTLFQDEFEIYVQGVEQKTAVLPEGWQARLIEVRGRDYGIRSKVLCLDPYDLCAAKMARLEMKDRSYIAALVRAGDIDVDMLQRRLSQVTDPRMTPALCAQAEDFIAALRRKD